MNKKHKTSSVHIALGATIAISLTGANIVSAEVNPFEFSVFDQGYLVAVDPHAAVETAKDAVTEAVKETMTDAPGRDMQGNLVNYEYGGDSKGTYAGGKVGTGSKDPGVCGSFTGAVCGADGGGHLNK